jgi:hypothetical protein
MPTPPRKPVPALKGDASYAALTVLFCLLLCVAAALDDSVEWLGVLSPYLVLAVTVGAPVAHVAGLVSLSRQSGVRASRLVAACVVVNGAIAILMCVGPVLFADIR